MKVIYTPDSPKPAGHYSQAIVHNGLVFISGQLPINPNRNDKTLYSIEEQTMQVLKNINEILLAAGSDKSMVLKTTVYISDIDLWSYVNEAYASFFGNHKPARTVVPTKDLHYGYSIEMDVIAALKDS